MTNSQKICSIQKKMLLLQRNSFILTLYTMRRNFLPAYVGIAMTKSQFCFSTGCTPYRLKQTIEKNEKKYRQLGVTKYDKMLMPIVVNELLSDTGLRIDIDYYTQYVAGQRGIPSEIIHE